MIGKIFFWGGGGWNELYSIAVFSTTFLPLDYPVKHLLLIKLHDITDFQLLTILHDIPQKNSSMIFHDQNILNNCYFDLKYFFLINYAFRI